MGFKKKLLIGVLVIGFAVGFILFLDEITMVFPFLIDLGVRDRFLGDLSQYHIEPIHHWQFGVFLMILSVVGLFAVIKADD